MLLRLPKPSNFLLRKYFLGKYFHSENFKGPALKKGWVFFYIWVMYIIVGLGNPGTQYSNTHHNAGFMAVEKLADPSKDWKSEHKALTMKVNIAGEECLLAKPKTADLHEPVWRSSAGPDDLVQGKNGSPARFQR